MKLLGTNTTLLKFLSNEKYSIDVKLPEGISDSIAFESGREYIIPEYQREIRWKEENIELLIEDLASGPKYLGNIIITKNGIDYEFIDGQQRITSLIMILKAIKDKHSQEIDIIECCNLKIKSFEKFDYLLENSFSDDLKYNEDIINTDKLCQIDKYYELWKFINEQDDIKNKDKAGKLIKNIRESEMNIIVNNSDDAKASIQFFLDVNIKGIKLDTEDIFKSYLIKNDQSDDIKHAWYELKSSVIELEKENITYPLLDIIRHYLLCELHKKPELSGLEFDTEFEINKAFTIKDETKKVFRKGSHIIEIINDKSFMLNVIKGVNDVTKCLLDIVKSSANSQSFKKLFQVRNGKIDSLEIDIIHNLMNKILKDSLVLPKSLLVKYILHIYSGEKDKNQYKKIYGVYLLAILFTIFSNRKSENVLISVLRANDADWYNKLIDQIRTYFEIDNITNAKLFKKYRMIKNEEEENYKFRCRSLAAIYNYFSINNGVVDISNVNDFSIFIKDSSKYSTEHLIVSENDGKSTIIEHNDKTIEYIYEKGFYNKIVNSLFNFVFVPESLNYDLGNLWLPSKMNQLENKTIDCQYSKLVLEKVKTLSGDMQKRISEEPNVIEAMDVFLRREFEELYINYSREILKTVLNKLRD